MLFLCKNGVTNIYQQEKCAKNYKRSIIIVSLLAIAVIYNVYAVPKMNYYDRYTISFAGCFIILLGLNKLPAIRQAVAEEDIGRISYTALIGIVIGAALTPHPIIFGCIALVLLIFIEDAAVHLRAIDQERIKQNGG
jgi:hypothetical protein